MKANTPAAATVALARLALAALDAQQEAEAFYGDMDKKRAAKSARKALRDAAHEVLHPKQAQPKFFWEEV